MYLFQILLPRADNVGEPFPEDEYERVKEELARAFDGVTAYLQAPAEGVWRRGERSTDDDIVVFEVMSEKVELEGWRKRRMELEQRFRQDRVIIRYIATSLV